MSDDQSQPTIRELRQHLTQPTTQVAILGVAGILAIAGPFETGEVLRLVPRFAYWLVLVAASYAIGFVISEGVRKSLTRLPLVELIVLSSLATGICVSLLVAGLNFAVFGFLPPPEDLPGFVGPILVISIIVSGVSTVLARELGGGETKADQIPAILDRIPFEKRGDLVALSVEDHYVRVITLKGEELILMRLSDAIRETAPAKGAQVHRSHLAAFDQVHSAKRIGDRAVLAMRDGSEIPVSRSNIARIKEAGLLS